MCGCACCASVGVKLVVGGGVVFSSVGGLVAPVLAMMVSVARVSVPLYRTTLLFRMFFLNTTVLLKDFLVVAYYHSKQNPPSQSQVGRKHQISVTPYSRSHPHQL